MASAKYLRISEDSFRKISERDRNLYPTQGTYIAHLLEAVASADADPDGAFENKVLKLLEDHGRKIDILLKRTAPADEEDGPDDGAVESEEGEWDEDASEDDGWWS